MEKKKQPKTWEEIKEEFNEYDRMSCKPDDMEILPSDHIFDENKSVKWNREQVEVNNEEYEKEVARLKRIRNKKCDKINEDIYYKIQYEVGHNLSYSNAIAFWNLVLEYSYVINIHEAVDCLKKYIELIKKLLTDESEK